MEQTNGLFQAGLQIFILRLPGKSIDEYQRYLLNTDRIYHGRVFLPWEMRDIAEQFPIGGLYLKASEAKTLTEGEKNSLTGIRVIVGCHSIEEFEQTDFPVSFFLLSPVFDSVSKKGYMANPLLVNLKDELRNAGIPVLAMGGVTPENYLSLFEMGYSGAAVIGSVWEDPLGPLHAYEQFPKPAILSIAGHDPSGGAGIDADRETATHFGFRCFTVPTVVTTQDEDSFEGFEPVPDETILRTVRFLLEQHPEIRGIKIGMISSLSLLRKALDVLREFDVRNIVWDPIVSASKSDQKLFTNPDKTLFRDCLRDIEYVTPNAKEYDYWFDDDTLREYPGLVIIKGVDFGDCIADIAAYDGEKQYFVTSIPGGSDRHGTGCRYSTAFLCETLLGNGYGQTGILKAQEYVHAYRVSSSKALRFEPFHRKRKALTDNFFLQYVTNDYSPETIEKVLNGGCRWVQLRMKDATNKERIQALKAIRPICDKYDAVLIIDDDVRAAREGGADGVHLGKNDMSPTEARGILGENFIIGATVNDADMLLEAFVTGADYAGAGPYKFTKTKKNLSPMLGTEGIENLCRFNRELTEPLPLVAIGGITLEDVPEVWETGVDGIAVSGAIERAENITSYTQHLVKEWERQSQRNKE